MMLNLPPEIEAIAKEKAAQAGVDDIGVFVERLIETASPEQAHLPLPADPAIVEAIREGVASGVGAVADDAFWQARLAKVANNRPSAS